MEGTVYCCTQFLKTAIWKVRFFGTPCTIGMFNCSKIEDELAEKQIVIFHKSVEYWPKMLRSVELTQAVGIHIDYEERNYGQKGSSIPSALS